LNQSRISPDEAVIRCFQPGQSIQSRRCKPRAIHQSLNSLPLLISQFKWTIWASSAIQRAIRRHNFPTFPGARLRSSIPLIHNFWRKISPSIWTTVFGYDFEQTTIDGNEMAWFPLDEAAPGVTGALAKGESYTPSTQGTLVYFRIDSIDETLAKVQENGGKTLYPKTALLHE
jgi:hypothetical protein